MHFLVNASSTCLSKGFATHLARVRFFPTVYSKVDFKDRFEAKDLAAYWTSMGFPSSSPSSFSPFEGNYSITTIIFLLVSHSHWGHVQVCSSGLGSVCIFPIPTFGFMDSGVRPKVGDLSKGFATVRANERFFSCVDTAMNDIC